VRIASAVFLTTIVCFCLTDYACACLLLFFVSDEKVVCSIALLYAEICVILAELMWLKKVGRHERKQTNGNKWGLGRYSDVRLLYFYTVFCLKMPRNTVDLLCRIIQRLLVALLQCLCNTGCVNKNDPTCFCQNFVKSPSNLTIFGIQTGKIIEICKVYSLSTSPCLCQRTTV